MFAKVALALFAASAALAAPVFETRDYNTTSNSTETYSGRATYYSVTGTGACGWKNTGTEMVVALNKPQFNPDSDGFSDYCGYTVVITNTDNGYQYNATVVDECPECKTGSLDMSPTLFGKLSDEDYDEGVFPITWNFA